MVTQDEIFHFKRPIKPRKVHMNVITNQQDQIKSLSSSSDMKSPSDIKSEPCEIIGMMDDSLDGGGPPSVNSDIQTTSSPAPSIASTPLSTKGKQIKFQKKVVTGYILYSSEIRRGIRTSNPDASFGDVSRMVGIEWKNLPSTVKQAWEDKAAKLNEESKHQAALLAEEALNCPSPIPSNNNETNGPYHIYECLWTKCNYQFEDPIDCMQHCIADDTGHVQTYYADKGTEGEFQCMWRTCMRYKKNLTPFPNLTRLIKHVRDVHLNKGPKTVLAIDKSK